MKRTLTALFAAFVLAFGAQSAIAADDPGDTPGKSPYHKTHGDQTEHAKPGKGGGKGLGHCLHSPGGCNESGGGGNNPGDDDNDSSDNDSSDNEGALANTGA
jgi:hypothetical protein